MALKHDAQGFLSGDPIDIGQTLATWNDIKQDVRAIRQAMAGTTAAVAPGTQHGNATDERAQPPALPAGRRGDEREHRVITPHVGTAATPTRGKSASASGLATPSTMKDARDVGGRGEMAGAIRSLSDRVVSAVGRAGGGMEEADPAVKAFQEIAQPMARGYAMMTGGSADKKQVGFLRRIFNTLTGFRSDETVFNKAANKSLKNIEAKPATGGESGGGLLGSLSGLLGKIPIIGPALGGAASLLGGAGSGLMGAGKGLLGAGKGILRKLPIIGGLLGAAGAASDVYSSENDDTLTRRQKDERGGKAIGGFGGSLAGMAAGASLGAIGGPIGMAIGGAVGMFLGDQAGQIIGDKVGGWVSDLREADIPGKITSTWDGTMSAIKSGWESMAKKAGALWEDVKKTAGNVVEQAKDVGNRANEAVKSATGIDVKAGAGKAVDAAVQSAGTAGEAVKKGATWATENTTLGKGAAKVWEGAKSAGEWALGKTSQMFESGKGGAGTVSSGKGDFGGASYGTYQLSSKQGEVQKFLKTSKYGDQFAGLQPGTPEFNAKWKEVSKADPEFGGAQHDYIKATKFDPVMAGLKKSGIDLSKDGAAVQDAIWSTSVQFGAGGAQSLVKSAFKGKDVSKMSEAEKISAIQDYKIANNEKLFSKSDDNVRAGTAKRAVEEKKRLLALSDQDAAAPQKDDIKVASLKDDPTKGGRYSYEDLGSGKLGVTDKETGVSELASDEQAKAYRINQGKAYKDQLAAANDPNSYKPGGVYSNAAPSVQSLSVAPATPVTAFAAAPKMPTFASPPTIAEAPPVVDTLASGGDGRKTVVATAPPPDVGQDVKDRRIAHIVTGGFSA